MRPKARYRMLSVCHCLSRLMTSHYLSNSDAHLKVTAGSNESLLVRSRFVTSDLAKIRRNLHSWCMPPSLVRLHFCYQINCHPHQQTCHVQPQLQQGVRHDDTENQLFPSHQVSLLLVSFFVLRLVCNRSCLSMPDGLCLLASLSQLFNVVLRFRALS